MPRTTPNRCLRPCAIVAAVLVGAAAQADPPAAAGAPTTTAPGPLDRLWTEVARFRAYPHFDRAYRLIRSGRDEPALAELLDGLRHEPNNGHARLALMDALVRLGRKDQALLQAGHMLAQDAAHAGALRRRAVLRLEAGDKLGAARDLRALLARSTLAPEERNMAQTLLDRATATVDGTGSPRLVLETPPWMERLRDAQAHAAAGRWQAAVDDYGVALRLTSHVPTRLNLLQAQAAIARERGKVALLRTSLQASVALAPHDLESVRELIVLAQQAGQRFEQRRWLAHLAARSQTAADLEFIANVHYAAGELPLAVHGYRRALAQVQEPGARHRLSMHLGHAESARGAHAAAAEAFRQAARARPRPETLQALSHALAASGDRLAAEEVLRTLVQQHPSAAHRLQLATLQASGPDPARAIEPLRLVAADAAAPPSVRLSSQRQLVVLLALQGDPAGVRESLNEVLRLDPHDQAARLALAQACADAGDAATAAHHFDLSIAQGPTPAAYRGLAAARAALQDRPGTAAAYRGLLAQPGLAPAEVAATNARLGDTLLNQGLHAQASLAYQAALDSAAQVDEAGQPGRVDLGSATLGGATLDSATLDSATLGSATLGSATRGSATRGSANPGGADPGGADPSSAALGSPDVGGLDLGAVHLGLGYALAGQQHAARAMAHFEAAYRAQPRPGVALQLARTAMALDRPQDALRHGAAALADPAALAPDQQRVLLQEMANLQLAAGQPREALPLLQRALALSAEPQAALALANAQLLAQEPQEALLTLAIWPPSAQAPAAVTAQHLDLQAQAHLQAGRPQQARALLAQAQHTEALADRQYRLALLDIDLGPDDAVQAAVQTVRELAATGPDHMRESAAHGLYRAGQFGPAARLYGEAAQAQPRRADLLRGRAYALMRDGQNGAAAQAFMDAIDATRASEARLADAGVAMAALGPLSSMSSLSSMASMASISSISSMSGMAPGPTRSDGAPFDPALAALQNDTDSRALDVWRMRQEVRKLNKNFDFTLYESYRSNTADTSSMGGSATGSVAGAGAGTGSGVVASQGGVEAAWRLPGVGLRDDRTLHAFGRLTWSHEPESLSIDRHTAQGSVGLRYKPLRTQQFYVSGERLIKAGSQAQTDWLLRASYGWTDGLGIDDPDRTHWNYSSFYVDVGRFTDQRLSAAYVEVRQGHTWRVADQVLLSPHVVLAARHQRPDVNAESYSEAGMGVSARGFFNATEYEAPRSSAELLVQYKHGFKRVNSGWSVTAVLAF